MVRIFFYLHVLGIMVLLGGVAAYMYPEGGLQTTGAMVGVASAIGLGLVMISPYPVVMAIQLMSKESSPAKKADDGES